MSQQIRTVLFASRSTELAAVWNRPLALAGFDLVYCGRVSEVLDQLKDHQRANFPSLLITSDALPHDKEFYPHQTASGTHTGPSLLEAVRDLCPDFPVIILVDDPARFVKLKQLEGPLCRVFLTPSIEQIVATVVEMLSCSDRSP